MKKILISSLFLLTVLLVPHTSFATSGACSYHGGVDCSAGASLTGNAICSDGYISSTSYYLTAECSSTTFINRCPYPMPQGCSQTSQLGYYQTMITLANRDGTNADTAIANLAKCQQEIADYADLITKHNQCMVNEYGYDPVSGKIVQTKAQTDAIANAQVEAAKQLASQNEASCHNSMGPNSNFNSGRCYCNPGYLTFNGKCVSQDDALNICKVTGGPNSFVIGSENCGCIGGYQKNSNGLCVNPNIPTPQATPIVHTTNKILFSKNLKYGSSGDDVKLLQTYLSSKGLFNGDISGNYYSKTQQAVIAFQRKNNISPASGFFGEKTRLFVNVNQ